MEDMCQNLPQSFLDKIPRFLEPVQLEKVLHAFSSDHIPSFRINMLKTTIERVKDSLENQDFSLEQISWYEEAFLLRNKSLRELTETEEYKTGQIYIQSLSSMIPALILDPQPDETVLDMAAAPGSKTTQMATLMQNTGELTANDSSRTRLYKLRQNILDQGVTNVKVTTLKGENIWRHLPEYFDKVLLDAPCSMEGRFDCRDEKTFIDWSPKKVKILAKLQGYLLRSAISCTKVGGTIVYSTCTLSPEENEGVIDWILKKEGDSIKIEEIKLPGINFLPGITNFTNKPYLTSVQKTARILPSEIMEGFFIAKIKKHRASITQ